MFSRFCLPEIIVRPFISLMAKCEVYNVLTSKLEYFEKDIHVCQDIEYTATLSKTEFDYSFGHTVFLGVFLR